MEGSMSNNVIMAHPTTTGDLLSRDLESSPHIRVHLPHNIPYTSK